MKKECVFCGKKPQSKTNEHIIPQWLIALTGDPNREILIGYKKDGSKETRQYSFSSFKFPSCSICNEMFSKLENDAKDVITKLLNLDGINANDLNTLLDWFDKIRTGLWLANYNLDKNFANITPNFRIADRIGKFDRMLKIARADSLDRRVNWGGTETAIFNYIPSCFSLVINNLYFLNLSYDFLFSRRLGFPFPKEKYIHNYTSNYQEINLSDGIERIHRPIFRKHFKMLGTEFYQPMWGSILSKKSTHTLYNKEYIRSNSTDFDSGIGAIFFSHSQHEGLQKYFLSESKKWIHPKIYERNELIKIISKEVLEWQLYIQEQYPSLERLTPDERKDRNRFIKMCASINKKLLKLMN